MSAASASPSDRGSGTALTRELRRAAGRDHNPLCRPADRARSRLGLALAVTLALSVVMGVLLALTLLAGMRAQAHRTALHRHQVTATTLAVASGSSVLTTAPVRASWDYPRGDHRTGVIRLAVGTASGAVVPLSVDDAGNPAAPPQPDSRLATTAGMYGLGAFTAAGTIVWTGYAVGRRMLDRRAEQAWEPDWERVEPLWSGRSRRPENGER
ncbi:Rv1733c family protein [Kitasatospora sp. NBC_01266]|uniref:Rv1733c family protein n=1 Tax=Kitasatospora sp. NBC_01266 TaxID=2903572 RepID=UPI002E3061E6|nr:hypothetical protein [Kitasatospora sp. NBC_01266]